MLLTCPVEAVCGVADIGRVRFVPICDNFDDLGRLLKLVAVGYLSPKLSSGFSLE
jgi:hypothetical protein